LRKRFVNHSTKQFTNPSQRRAAQRGVFLLESFASLDLRLLICIFRLIARSVGDAQVFFLLPG
jgi:ribosomal protein S4